MTSFFKGYQANSLILVISILSLSLTYLKIAQADSFSDAKHAFQIGHYEQAIKHWESASIQDINKRVEASLGIAAAYRYLGLYDQALRTLNTALPQVRQNPGHHALILNELSQLYQYDRQLEKAIQTSKQAVALADESKDSFILAQILRQWGKVASAEDDYEEALDSYVEALGLLSSSRPISKKPVSKQTVKALQGKLLINQAQTRFLLDLDSAYQYTDKIKAFEASITALDNALNATHNWPDAYNETFGLIALAQLAQEIQAQFNQPFLNRQAYQALNQALKVAQRIDNAQAKTYAYGQMGLLYEQSQRYDDALVLTQRALFWAQQINEQQLLYRWQWQLGRIFKAQGNYEQAIKALQQAVNIINNQFVREQIVKIGYHLKTFREQVAPVYFELADLLLQQGAKTQNTSSHHHYLREARESIEGFKTAELQDYFQNECITFQTECTPLKAALDSHTAILYPIVLSDRLELLLTLPHVDKLKQITVPVNEENLRREIAFFLSSLRKHPLSYGLRADEEDEEDEEVACAPSSWKNLPLSTEESTRAQAFLKHAQKLYRWLIQPLKRELTSHQIKTLILVPEGVLRTLPFSALHDGQQFLIQDYALATAPGLCLSGLKKQQWEVSNILVSGLSEAVQGFSSLPCAEYEKDTLQQLYQLYNDSHIPLFNETFTYPNMQNNIQDTRYSIVHIASHGQFKSNLDDTFLLTYDDKLSLDRLERLIRRSTFQQKQVELLTLSACETAVGNDRAALGLAGVALKAGAKSALATLWKVDDAATPAIVIEFYKQLVNQRLSKAQALQKAQKKMLNNRKYRQFRHPYYWSAFLLIGNWL
jgi:CHAT domain-containing protein